LVAFALQTLFKHIETQKRYTETSCLRRSLTKTLDTNLFIGEASTTAVVTAAVVPAIAVVVSIAVVVAAAATPAS
jgi:hypothetical protein